MADIKAQAHGYFNVGATWTGGVAPGPGDIAYANGYNIFVDASLSVQALSVAAGSGISAGGSFNIEAHVTIDVADGLDASVHTSADSSCIAFIANNIGGGVTVTINGDVVGGGGTGRHALGFSVTNHNDLVVNGNVTGGSGSFSHAISAGSTGGNTTINGDVTGGPGSTAVMTRGGIYTVNGNVSAAGSRNAIGIHASGAEVFIVGNLTPATVPATDGISMITVSSAGGGGGYPLESDVRVGEIFGATGEYVGELLPAELGFTLADLAAVTGTQIAAALA